jgi:hypothetical protein
MANPYRDEIISQVTGNSGQFTYKQLADQFNITAEQVRGVARQNNLTGFFRKARGNGIIDPRSTLQPKEREMRQATQADLDALREHCEKHGLPYDQRRLWWHKTKEFSVSFFDAQKAEEDKQAQEQFLKRIKQAAPKIQKKPVPTKTLAIPANFDVHLGKHCQLIHTGNDYTPDKAIRQVLEGQAALYEMTKPFGVTDILLPMGNDVVHVDNNAHTSTAGTSQDAYGSVESMIMLAAELYIKSIEEFAKRHNVWLAHVHSNHDRVAGWSVSQMVAAYFRNHPRVRIHPSNIDQRPMKYFIFGHDLIVLMHGESKQEEILGTIQQEIALIGKPIRRIYCYIGHRHHKEVHQRGAMTLKNKEKDHSGVTTIKTGEPFAHTMHVEMVRSPSPADQWHKLNTYNNLPAVEMFVHSERSQIARLTHWF